jgi:hypothetical protein
MIPAPLPGQPLSVGQAITLFNTLLGDLRIVVEGEVAITRLARVNLCSSI